MNIVGAVIITAIIIGLTIIGYMIYKKFGEKHGYKGRFGLG